MQYTKGLIIKHMMHNLTINNLPNRSLLMNEYMLAN
jgi:hypothetical protein